MNVRGTARIVVVCLFALVALTRGADAYTNTADAIWALVNADTSSKWSAVEYLAKHPEESVPILMKMVENQEKGWIYGSAALIRTKDERVVPFYIELLQNNYYAKEADGTRKQYGLGTKNGCCVMPFIYGGVLAHALGEMGDKRAIPVLKEAAKQGDSEVRKNAYDALYKLGCLSLDDLFRVAKAKTDEQVNIPNILSGIGYASIHSDTRSALKVFDRIISELPEYECEIVSAHFGKVQCFELLKQYDDAIRECDEVLKFPKYENLIRQIKDRRAALERLGGQTNSMIENKVKTEVEKEKNRE